jgi:hypothetical protein
MKRGKYQAAQEIRTSIRRLSMPETNFSDDQAPTRSPQADVIFTDLDGREGVLLDLNTKRYYLLNETASFVWKGLERGLSAGAIAEEMTAMYDVSLEHAAASVTKVLEDFQAYKLIRID